MAGETGNFALLLDLAKETSSEKRRELLRKVTDVFLENDSERTDRESEIFDEIFDKVANDLETQVRQELARKIAGTAAPVRRTARRLAMDEISVARVVLERSSALTEDDIIEVIHKKTQDHMMAVTRRVDIGERVSSALVDRGEDHVVASLLENRTARIGREAFEKVAERAQTSVVLQAPFVKNQRVPLDLLNSVYFKVEAQLRKQIMRRFHGVSPADLEAALAAGRNQVSSAYGALPADYPAAEEYVAGIEKWNPLAPPILVTLLRENRSTAFMIVLARLVGVEFDVVQRVVEAADLDAIAMLCRGAGFDRGLFVSMCLLIAGEDYSISNAEKFGELYEQVPIPAAQRALRFWKVRAKSGAHRAA
ncbi:MAG: DUF2336 domain-containing protein [Hyphomonadaceae bacterium]